MALGLARLAAVALASLALGPYQAAKAQTFVGSYTDTGNGNVDTAKAVFSLVTGTTTYLQVVVSNTSTFRGGYNNADALSGFFFEIAGDPTLNMATSSATTGTLVNPSGCASSQITYCGSSSVNVGAEWNYEYSKTGFSSTNFSGSGAHYGVATSGYSSLSPSFGKGNVTAIGSSPPNLVGKNAQLAFSIVGSNFNNSTAANDMQSLPYANSSITFDFALPTGATSVSLSNVSFTYGTAPDASAAGVPASEPTSVGLFGIGAVAMGFLRRRRCAAGPSGTPPGL